MRQLLTAIDVVTVQGFCSLTSGIGLATLGRPLAAARASSCMTPCVYRLGGPASSAPRLLCFSSLLTRPAAPSRASRWSSGAGSCGIPRLGHQLSADCARAAGSSASRPACSTCCCRITRTSITSAFLGAYAAAVTAGIVSHVPGGIGVFETVIILAIPQVPASQLLGSMLVYRGVYYLVPLAVAALLFGAKELEARRSSIARAHELMSLYLAPVVPQVAGTLIFVSGAVLLISGATPAIDTRHRCALSNPAAGHYRGVPPRGKRDRRRAHRAGARAVSAGAGGLSHLVLAAGRGHRRFAAQGPRFRGRHHPGCRAGCAHAR